MHLWWGDERFLPDGDPDRNETQARDALLDRARRRAAGGERAPDGRAGRTTVRTPVDSAVQYCDELARFAAAGRRHGGPASRCRRSTSCCSAMGPDGHVASLFPGHDGLAAGGTGAVGVHECPKPPPERVTLTYDAIHAAREVWVVAAGAEKAAAVASALAGAPVDDDARRGRRRAGAHAVAAGRGGRRGAGAPTPPAVTLSPRSPRPGRRRAARRRPRPLGRGNGACVVRAADGPRAGQPPRRARSAASASSRIASPSSSVRRSFT